MDDDPLAVRALATFHVTALVAVVVCLLYWAGPLPEYLAGLDTATGLGLFVALWATTLATTRRALRAAAASDAGHLAVLRPAFAWGGANGAAFFWVLVAVVFLPDAPPLVAHELPFYAIFATVGSALAATVGALTGVVFAELDRALFGIAGWLVGAEPSESGESGESGESNA